MKLNVHNEGQGKIFGPNDIVTGTIALNTPGNVLISEVSVTFMGKSFSAFSSPYLSDNEAPLEEIFFCEKTIVYFNEKAIPKPPLPAGSHRWAFQFRLPADNTNLPPSFVSARTIKTHLDGTDLPKDYPIATKQQNISFWPNRYTELPDGPFPKEHRLPISVPRNDLSIPFQKEDTGIFRKLRSKAARPRKYDDLSLIALVPRYNILGQPFEVRLSIGPNDGIHGYSKVTLKSVRYTLHAVTQVRRQSSTSNQRHYRFAEIAFEQDCVNIDIAFPEYDQFIYLHNIAPVKLAVNAGWSYKVPLGLNVDSPLCPTFDSALSSRNYTLSLIVSVSCEGKVQARRFEETEIVLLPTRLDPSVKKLPTEVGEGAVVEKAADSVPIPELPSENKTLLKVNGEAEAQEVHGEGVKPTELAVKDAAIAGYSPERLEEFQGSGSN